MRRSLNAFLLGSLVLGIGLANSSFGQGLGATPAKAFRVPKGFEVELVYDVPLGDQGSWVSMCVDLKGRLIVSDQYGKLYRVTPAASGAASSETKVEVINVNLGMAQGLLHTKDGLYVDVNGIGTVRPKPKKDESAPGEGEEKGAGL